MRQFELLLRAIYRPNNIHCVHVDRKSPQKFKDDVAKIVRCLPNAFVASDAVELIYTHYSRVEADLVCMKQLIERFACFFKALAFFSFGAHCPFVLISVLLTLRWTRVNCVRKFLRFNPCRFEEQ